MLAEAAGSAVVLAYAAATLTLAALGVHALVMTALRVSHRPRPLRTAPIPTPAPTAVVQIPVYDEPPALVARALDHALALEWPGRVEVQLLDDSPPTARRRNAELCATRGVRHLARTGRDGFKAGALGWGLAHTDATLAAVFDVDFRPAPGTLLHLAAPLLADPGLAFVQARWSHAPDSALGQAEAAVLDLHFAVEQTGRDRAGLPVLFNGTAGLWRVAAIEDAGGWRGDTLAEDLDLTVRALARGWRSRLADVSVPADLPPTVAAWRRQQARWAKGLAEVARLHAGTLWRSGLGVASKLALSAHAALSLSLPSLLALVVLHPLAATTAGLGAAADAVQSVLAVGYVGLGGVVAAHAVTMRALGLGWRRVGRVPLALVAPLVLVVPATRAVAQAVLGRRSAFARTPKVPRDDAEAGGAEVALAAWSALGLAALVGLGVWEAVPFQVLLTVGTVGAAVAVRWPVRAVEPPAAFEPGPVRAAA